MRTKYHREVEVVNSSASSIVEVVLRDEALSLSTDLDLWLQSIKTKIGMRILGNLASDTSGLDRYIEFAEIKELPGAFIACSFYQQDINDALTRAGIYMGAGKGLKADTLARQSDFTIINYKKLVAGHNLPGSVLRNFFAAIQQSTDELQSANAAEAAVLEHFLKSDRVSKLEGLFYLIGFSIQTMKDQKGVISHEVLHAYSFLNPAFRQLVSDFWRETVSPEDKASITDEIGKAYNVNDQDLVIDEFQAYLIQSRADHDRMKNFVPKYRALLLDKIRQLNLEVPAVQGY